jgi:Nucleotide modification associated domain 3
MKAILVRIGVDAAYGGWNAPVDPRTGQFVFVPIPDGVTKEYTPGNARGYDEIAAPLAEFAEKCNVGELRLPETLRQRSMHLDPDFDHLTYGDNGVRRGARIATLGPNDLLVFYAGLRSVVDRRRLVYALVGLFVVVEVVRAIKVPAERRFENAHTRWTTISENDVIVRGKSGVSGRFDRCVPIGEWRDKAYRVCRGIENVWGGLTVKNGYIQRSAVPPAFVHAEEFYEWFQRQGIKLLQRNN